MIRRLVLLALLSFAVLAPVASAQAPEDVPGEAVAAVPAEDDLQLTSDAGDPPAPPAPVEEPAQEVPVGPPIVQGRAVLGRVAKLRTDGKAAVPLGAPKRIRLLISAINEIVGKPYKWGGGHAKVFDRGYDCSGAVSYGLLRVRLLAYPLDSRLFMRYAAAGPGRWLTIYSSKGHAYMEVAGLRLDTSPISNFDRRDGVRWREMIGKRPGFKARHIPGL